MNKGQELYKKAKKIIPGGTQLLSKRPEMFLPDHWPSYYSKAKGCEIWDLDGNRFIDMSMMGIGACILGYADPDVNLAVEKAVKSGNLTTLNVPEEIELAELLCEIHPWAKMVRFARTGGEAVAIAIRIARAYTGRDKILFGGYHGWSDWYLAANIADDKALDGHLLKGLNPFGVPRVLKGTALPFFYNDTEGFLKLIEEKNDEIGAVIIEPVRNQEPKEGFFETIRSKTKEYNIVFISDEVSAGFRMNIGGGHLYYGFEPDIAVFAKGMSNGFPMAAIIGRAEIMNIAQDSFISSTYWTDRIGPVSAIETINKMKQYNVPEHLSKVGRLIQKGWEQCAKNHKLDVSVFGIYPLGHFNFNYSNNLVLKTLFTQMMLQKGFLATNAFYASYAHKEEHIEKYLEAVDETFNYISEAVLNGNPEKYLRGPVCHAGFQRLDVNTM